MQESLENTARLLSFSPSIAFVEWKDWLTDIFSFDEEFDLASRRIFIDDRLEMLT